MPVFIDHSCINGIKVKGVKNIGRWFPTYRYVKSLRPIGGLPGKDSSSFYIAQLDPVLKDWSCGEHAGQMAIMMKHWKGNMNKLLSQPLFRHPNLVVAPCKLGHGVFATQHIPADTTLEECHHLRIRKKDCSGIIDDYVYNIAEEEGEASQEASECYSLPLGCGSLFNHSDEHNTEYWHDTERDLIVFYTIKDISAGEQLFINYGKDWWETRDCTPENNK